jgi:hypothetical protein
LSVVETGPRGSARLDWRPEGPRGDKTLLFATVDEQCGRNHTRRNGRFSRSACTLPKLSCKLASEPELHHAAPPVRRERGSAAPSLSGLHRSVAARPVNGGGAAAELIALRRKTRTRQQRPSTRKPATSSLTELARVVHLPRVSTQPSTTRLLHEEQAQLLRASSAECDRVRRWPYPCPSSPYRRGFLRLDSARAIRIVSICRELCHLPLIAAE